MTSGIGGIPAWNSSGVLPAIRPNLPGSSADRSPYTVDLELLIDRFSTSPERMDILDGLLRFRSNLHHIGVVSGFQWLDGSFLEDIEALESRAPRDMDVVTFLRLPDGDDQVTLVQRNSLLFDQNYLKSTYAVDGYFESPRVLRRLHYLRRWSHEKD